MWNALSLLRRPAARSAATYAAGVVTGAAACAAFYEAQDGQAGQAPTTEALARFEKKLRKLQHSAQERVHWAAMDQEMLGLAPRLWMEVLDQKHRYATLLHHYYRRWQLSDTRDYFFHWLDFGQGSMIDLPHAPKRLLDEWRVLYLRRDQQPMFRVRIEPETGRFLWEVDNTPVTLPAQPLPFGQAPANPSPRELAVAAIFQPVLEKACHRDRLLSALKDEVERAKENKEELTRERAEQVTAPLVEEGLLGRLRDPFFAERFDAAPTPEGHSHLRAMPKLPKVLLPNLTWDDIIKAIEHDQGKLMKNPFPSGEARAKGKGIFVLDSFGPLYCGTKIRGVFHHSSFVRGHCVKVAGGISIVDGWLMELSPHSGHYQPGEQHVESMIDDWKAKGVDFSKVKVKPYVKEK